MYVSHDSRPVDPKGRVSIPVPYRSLFPRRDDPPVMVHYGDCYLTLLHPSHWRTVQRRLRRDSSESADLGNLTRDVNGFAEPSLIDKQGRIRIPRNLAEQVGIAGQVLFVGANDRIELWGDEDRFHRGSLPGFAERLKRHAHYKARIPAIFAPEEPPALEAPEALAALEPMDRGQ